MDKPITFEDYKEIIAALRDPENGCPWDRAQTLESLIPCMIHEMTEAIAGIEVLEKTKDPSNLEEELGDVLLQVVLQSRICEELGLFSIEDVIQKAGEKMIRRHPHVFGTDTVQEAVEVPGRWEEIKKLEKKGRSPEYELLQKEAVAHAADQVLELLAREKQDRA